MKSQKSLPQLSRKWPVAVRQVHGHSMVPVLPPGTVVYGWRWFRKLSPGDVVIFLHEGKEKIKRVEQAKGHKIFVTGDHKETSTDSRQFGWISSKRVIAKVLWPHSPKHRAEGVEPQ